MNQGASRSGCPVAMRRKHYDNPSKLCDLLKREHRNDIPHVTPLQLALCSLHACQHCKTFVSVSAGGLASHARWTHADCCSRSNLELGLQTYLKLSSEHIARWSETLNFFASNAVLLDGRLRPQSVRGISYNNVSLHVRQYFYDLYDTALCSCMDSCAKYSAHKSGAESTSVPFWRLVKLLPAILFAPPEQGHKELTDAIILRRISLFEQGNGNSLYN